MAGATHDARSRVYPTPPEAYLSDKLRAVARVVADYWLQGLAVERLELLRVFLQDPEEEFVGARTLEGRDRGGAVDAVSYLQGHLRFGVRIWKQGRVALVAP